MDGTGDTDGVLIHYGVKGMRWGVRTKGRTSESSSDNTKSAKKTKKAAKPDVKKLSDQELRDRLSRLNMEKQYRDLVGTQPVFNGRKAVTSILQNSGTAVGTTVLSAAALFAVKKAISRRYGPEVVAQMFPRKK